MAGTALFVIMALTGSAAAAADAPAARHVVVYAVPGRFGGWPANHGIWSWGDEILVGFSAGYYRNRGPYHHIDKQKPEEHLLARSRDGGETWTIENPSDTGALIPAGDALHGVPPPGLREKPWRDCPGGIPFTHPGFCLTARMTSVRGGPARFYYSIDRGHHWEGPFRLPLFGQPGIAARTDCIVDGRNECMLFLTAAGSSRREGPPLCARTIDGGRTWKRVSWIVEDLSGSAIMPSTVRLGPADLLTAVRRRDGPRRWIETYRSRDNAATWKLDPVPVAETGEGNPPDLIRLRDGRICLTYGYRAEPFGIRARLSDDDGRSWHREVILRSDCGGRDLGYTRTVQRRDGRLVTVYYCHDRPDSDRYIAATIWDPSAVHREGDL